MKSSMRENQEFINKKIMINQKTLMKQLNLMKIKEDLERMRQ